MARKSLCLAAVAAASAVLVSATIEQQPPSPPRAVAMPEHVDVLYAAPGDVNYSYGPKGDDLAAAMAEHEATSTFVVTYNGFSVEAQNAFQFAINILSDTMVSSVPIRVRANWVNLGAGVLGSAGATVGCMPTGGVANTWYAASLADKIQGSAFCAALAGETAEIQANFNSSFTAWEFGTSGVGVPGKYNFMSVVLHEVLHGLGFFGRFTSSGGIGTLGSGTFPYSYDRFAVTGAGGLLLDMPRPSAALHTQLTSNNTFFNGANATTRNGGMWPKLETHHMTTQYGTTSDNGWKQGSSYSHTDDVLYNGTPAGLMTWQLNSNEVYTEIGQTIKGIMQDQGWGINDGTPTPGQPTLISPSGTIATGTPNFMWNTASAATSYRLYVGPASGGAAVIDGTYTAASICGASTCTQPSPLTIAPGNYQWWVQGINSSGPGSWSAAMSFTVSAGTPGAATLTAPSGSGTSLTPTYTWNVGSGATWYKLWVAPSGGSPVIDTWYQASAVCGATTCSATPSTALSPMTAHNAYVQTWNSAGYGPWSLPRPFTTGAPAAPTLISPTGTINTTAPRYRWNASAGASQYYLWVQPTSGAPLIQLIFPSSVCSAGVCSATPMTELPNGQYTWWVESQTSFGLEAWSAPGTFTVSAVIPGAATPTWPLSGPQGAVRPAYEWNPVAGATWYYLWVQPTGGSAVITTWYFYNDICNGTCSVIPNVPLTPGTEYTWWVQTWNSRGTGPWSAGTTFTIATAVPGVTTLISPTGAGAPATPTFTFNRVPAASWYFLQVQASGGTNAVLNWYSADQICGPSTCSVPSPVSFASGSYTWWVRSWNDVGYGPWSSGMTFSR